MCCIPCTAAGGIGFLTACVSDLAELFGCVAGIPDVVTAISFVVAPPASQTAQAGQAGRQPGSWSAGRAGGHGGSRAGLLGHPVSRAGGLAGGWAGVWVGRQVSTSRR